MIGASAARSRRATSAPLPLKRTPSASRRGVPTPPPMLQHLSAAALFYTVVAVVLGGVVSPWCGALLGTNPVLWVAQFTLSSDLFKNRCNRFTWPAPRSPEID